MIWTLLYLEALPLTAAGLLVVLERIYAPDSTESGGPVEVRKDFNTHKGS